MNEFLTITAENIILPLNNYCYSLVYAKVNCIITDHK